MKNIIAFNPINFDKVKSCPNNKRNIFGKRIKVASKKCQRCKYYENMSGNIVVCKYIKENNSGEDTIDIRVKSDIIYKTTIIY